VPGLLLSLPVSRLLARFRMAGVRRLTGYRKLSAYTSMKGRGTRTPATATTEGCSSYSLRGVLWGDHFVPTSQLRANSSTGPGWSGHATATLGVSGERRELAASDDNAGIR
jgi:hypothetical protein